jgi:lipooligosaccharide transport system ATP-binding protein
MAVTTIKTSHLTKKFGDLVAVDGVSLEIEEGECFGLLGPNGAGKTSLIRMITAVSPPSGGEIWIMERELRTCERQVKALLGVVPQIDNLDPDLTVVNNLLTYARYFAIPKAEARRRSQEVLNLFQLEEKQNSHIRELSGGMKRRLLIARGLINQPGIMILDEPSIGLDPQARHLVWQKLRQLKSQKVTQLLSTQNMEEAAILCDRVAIIHLGKIMVIDTPQKLIARYVGKRVWEIELDSGKREDVIGELSGRGLEFEEVDNVVQVFHLDDELARSLPDLMARPRSATLEDVFFRLTGRSLLE